MTHTVNRPSLDQIQDRITAQLDVLRAARARYDRSPNGETADLWRLAEDRLNGLIDQWAKEVIRQQAEALETGRWKP